jgi:hypothetical protein
MAGEILLLNFDFEYTIRNVKESQVDLILAVTHQLLVKGDDVNLLLGNKNAIKKRTTSDW